MATTGDHQLLARRYGSDSANFEVLAGRRHRTLCLDASVRGGLLDASHEWPESAECVEALVRLTYFADRAG